MEKLNLTDFKEKVKIFEESTKNSEIQKQNSLRNQNKEFFVYSLIFLIALSEFLIYSGKIGEALYLYAGILAALFLISFFLKDKEVRNICQIFLLIPIFRLTNFSTPFFPKVPLLSIIFIYAPMAVPAIIVIINQKLTYEQVGLTLKNIKYYLPLSILISLILGEVEYSIAETVGLAIEFSPINLLILTFIMIFFIGLIEEIIFRSILQTTLQELFGKWKGLAFSSLLFGIIISGNGIYNILFAIFVGFLIGYIFQKTKSLPFIIMIHGFVNVFYIGIIPHLGQGLGLF